MYNAFLNAKEKHGMIKLKDLKGQRLNFIIEKHNTLIVRKAHRHLWTLFSKVMLDGEPLDNVNYHGMVVLGPEGIGKVSFIILSNIMQLIE